MRTLLVGLLIATVTGCMLTGCAGLQRAKETRLLSHARLIAWMRIAMIAEHPDGEVPTLDEVTAGDELLKERAQAFEVTPAWNNPAADKEGVLRQKKALYGRRAVALGNGSALMVSSGSLKTTCQCVRKCSA